MRSSHPAPEQAQCPICRAEISPDLKFCGACGALFLETATEEIRGLNYLLAELARWEAEQTVTREQADSLRAGYERRREELRAQLRHERRTAPAASQQASQPTATGHAPAPKLTPRRPLLETVADLQTIRLLLYTGAAMLLVGVIIWLRDILYLKLREPIVQAVLLATGTTAVLFGGWFTTLRMRLHLTGRALTLTGSLLVPVNFWFLVRSGLVEGQGHAWAVCALCAQLYALTAALLRERLYVYLASAATILTVWLVIYRTEREAIGLYALALMTLSLIFLHLSNRFSSMRDDGRANEGRKNGPLPAGRTLPPSQLWGPPLAHVALGGAGLALLSYLPWRLGAAPSFADGSFRLRSHQYDPGIVTLLFLMGAYTAWFAGRYIYAHRRVPLYTASALALFCAEFLITDGLRLFGPVQLLIISATVFVAGFVARALRGGLIPKPLQRASLIICVLLAGLIYPVLSAAGPHPITHGMVLALLAAIYIVAGEEKAGEASGSGPVVFACAALLVVQALIHLRAGDASLLAPCFSMGAFGLVLVGASWRRSGRIQYFRAGLYSLSIAFVLAGLSAGFDPLDDAEAYAAPVALLFLAASSVAARRVRDEYAADVRLLLWAGSLLLSAPLLSHALQYRLVLDAPAPWRDLATLCASLALILFGVLGRLRAPILIGALSLALELAALTMTSVDWLQIPLKVYLISVGALILLVWGGLEFRRDQLLALRQRLSERRATARERFGEWR